MADFLFEDERRQLAEELAQRDMDPIHGAHIEHLARQVEQSVLTYVVNREQLRLARIPELAEDEAPRRFDEDGLAAREQDYLEARTFLREDAHRLVEQIDHEFDQEQGEDRP